MSTDTFATAAQEIRQSIVARAARSVDAAVRSAWTRSAAAAALLTARRETERTAPAERVQLAGIVLLTAVAVHELVRPFVSIAALPLALHAIRLPVIALALAMIAGAGTIARAWPGSRLRRWLTRQHRAQRADFNS
jgi:hypothetical protein